MCVSSLPSSAFGVLQCELRTREASASPSRVPVVLIQYIVCLHMVQTPEYVVIFALGGEISFEEIKTRTPPSPSFYIYLHIFSFSCSSFFCVNPDFYLVSRTSHQCLSDVGLLVNGLSSFSSSFEKVFVFAFILEIYLAA